MAYMGKVHLIVISIAFDYYRYDKRFPEDHSYLNDAG